MKLHEIIEFADQLYLTEWSPSSKKLLRICLLSYIMLHTISLVPYKEYIWARNSLCSSSAIGFSDWRFAFYDLLSIPFMSDKIDWWIAAQLTTLSFGIFGFAPRVSSFLSLIFTLNLNNHCRGLLDGGNNLSEILLLMSCFVNSNYSSLSNRKFEKSSFRRIIKYLDSIISNLAFFGIQIQITIVYLTAAICKLNGKVWQEGTALYYILQNNDYSTKLFSAMVFDHFFLISIATYCTVCFQTAFPFLVWSRNTRAFVLVSGTIFHIGIAVGMGLSFFALFMIISYIAFLPEKFSKKITQLPQVLKLQIKGIKE